VLEKKMHIRYTVINKGDCYGRYEDTMARGVCVGDGFGAGAEQGGFGIP
jgi:hypothetical protein